MVKFYENAFSYDYPFPAVTLAYFLRYPNPLSTHVLSTDILSRTIDAAGRLHTTRLHRKRGKIPKSVLKLLPRSVGATASSETYILETSVVDVKEGWMSTESRNLEWTGLLSVVEKQVYRRPLGLASSAGNNLGKSIDRKWSDEEEKRGARTDVHTTVTFQSRFGTRKHKTDTPPEVGYESVDEEPKKGFFSSWSTSSIQKTIELIGQRRTRDQLVKSRDGMKIVLERLREGGLVGVVEGMRRDREAAGHLGLNKEGGGLFKKRWNKGSEDEVTFERSGDVESD